MSHDFDFWSFEITPKQCFFYRKTKSSTISLNNVIIHFDKLNIEMQKKVYSLSISICSMIFHISALPFNFYLSDCNFMSITFLLN